MPVLHRMIKTRANSQNSEGDVVVLNPSHTPQNSFDPGPLFLYIDNSLESGKRLPDGNQVVFGCAQGGKVYMIGYVSQEKMHQVALYRDGGSMETKVGIPTTPGNEVMHFFAVIGDNILTSSMKQTSKKFVGLTTPQILHLFRNDVPSLSRISIEHARLLAKSKIRSSLSKRRK